MINNLPNDFKGISVGDILARKKDDLDVYQSTQLVVRQLMSIKDGFKKITYIHYLLNSTIEV